MGAGTELLKVGFWGASVSGMWVVLSLPSKKSALDMDKIKIFITQGQGIFK